MSFQCYLGSVCKQSALKTCIFPLEIWCLSSLGVYFQIDGHHITWNLCIFLNILSILTDIIYQPSYLSIAIFHTWGVCIQSYGVCFTCLNRLWLMHLIWWGPRWILRGFPSLTSKLTLRGFLRRRNFLQLWKLLVGYEIMIACKRC